MTTTPMTIPTIGRARPSLVAFGPNAAYVPGSDACAPVSAIDVFAAAASTDPRSTTTSIMNLWLGGDVQSLDLGSEHAIKRTTPGSPEAMT